MSAQRGSLVEFFRTHPHVYHFRYSLTIGYPLLALPTLHGLRAGLVLKDPRLTLRWSSQIIDLTGDDGIFMDDRAGRYSDWYSTSRHA